MIETEVDVVPIVLVPDSVVYAAPVEKSDVEKAKQDLTVNVLRVMMVPPGVQTFSFTDHVVSPGQRWSLDQAGHVVYTLYMNN